MKELSNRLNFSKKVLLFILVLVSIWGLMRCIGSLTSWVWLTQLGIFPGPGYTFLSGLFVCGAAIVGIVVVIRQKPWVMRYVKVASGIIFGFYWMEILFMGRTSSSTGSLFYDAVLSVSVLLYFWLWG